MVEEFGAELDRAILDIGWRTEGAFLSVVTWFESGRRLKRILKRNPPSDEELKQVFERMLNKVAERLGQPVDKPGL